MLYSWGPHVPAVWKNKGYDGVRSTLCREAPSCRGVALLSVSIPELYWMRTKTGPETGTAHETGTGRLRVWCLWPQMPAMRGLIKLQIAPAPIKTKTYSSFPMYEMWISNANLRMSFAWAYIVRLKIWSMASNPTDYELVISKGDPVHGPGLSMPYLSSLICHLPSIIYHLPCSIYHISSIILFYRGRVWL